MRDSVSFMDTEGSVLENVDAVMSIFYLYYLWKIMAFEHFEYLC